MIDLPAGAEIVWPTDDFDDLMHVHLTNGWTVSILQLRLLANHGILPWFEAWVHPRRELDLTDSPESYATLDEALAVCHRTVAEHWASIDGEGDDPTMDELAARIRCGIQVREPSPAERCGDPMLDLARHWPAVPDDLYW